MWALVSYWSDQDLWAEVKFSPENSLERNALGDFSLPWKSQSLLPEKCSGIISEAPNFKDFCFFDGVSRSELHQKTKWTPTSPAGFVQRWKSLVHYWVSIAGSISALPDFFSWSVSKICLWSIGDLDWVSEHSGAVRLQFWLPKHILSRQCYVGLQVPRLEESAERWA